MLNNEAIPTNSNILQITAFLDESSILRAGGQLHYAQVNVNQRHQIILPAKHPLILTQLHIDNFHCGMQQLLNAACQNYWHITGKSLVKRLIHKCMKCYKSKPRSYEQLMARFTLSNYD